MVDLVNNDITVSVKRTYDGSLRNMRRAIARARLRTRLNCPRRAKRRTGKPENLPNFIKFQSQTMSQKTEPSFYLEFEISPSFITRCYDFAA